MVVVGQDEAVQRRLLARKASPDEASDPYREADEVLSREVQTMLTERLSFRVPVISARCQCQTLNGERSTYPELFHISYQVESRSFTQNQLPIQYPT